MDRQKSVFFKFALGFFCFYSLYTVGFYFYDVAGSLDVYKKNRTMELVRTTKLLTNLLKQPETQESLKDFLKDAYANGSIDLYELRAPDSLFTSTGSSLSEADKIPTGQLTYFPNVAFTKVQAGSTQLILASGFGINHKLNQLWRQNWRALAQDIVFALLFIVAMSFYYFRGIFSIFRAIRNNDKVALGQIGGDSAESQLLVQALGHYDAQLKDVREKNELLSKQLLPALRKEFELGKVFPYEFQCTMARTDINHFSNIFLNSDREPFMQSIDAFFWDSTHIINRYKGLVHSFAGDEIIFYFKEDDKFNATKLAVAAIHDIHLLADSMHAKIHKERGYPFMVKSSLAPGTLRFGKLVDSFSLAGTPFIETVRILSAIQEKEKNSLYLSASSVLTARNPFQFAKAGKAALKGYTEEVELYTYTERAPLELAIEKARQGDASLIAYYRSDQDLSQILEQLSCGDWNRDAFRATMSALRSFYCSKISTVLEESYSKFLAQELELRCPQRLPAALTLMNHLIPKENFHSTLKGLLAQALAIDEPRTKANAIELYTHFCPDEALPGIREYLASPDNRIFANAFVHAAVTAFDEGLVKKIGDALEKADSARLVSTIYAIGEIAAYYREKDIVFLQTRLPLMRLLYRLPHWVAHENPAVSLHALAAAKKFSDKKLNEKLTTLFAQTTDAGLLDRFEASLGWYREDNSQKKLA